jgi:FAD/FMN-containing dehydrogenase
MGRIRRRDLLVAGLLAAGADALRDGAGVHAAVRDPGSGDPPIDGFRGQLITAKNPEYDAARAVWNGAIDRRPRVIARCGTANDVVAAVRHARDRELEIAVRGGGHNVAGTAVCDDGIVIDLSAMRALSVDLVNSTALVQGGALWGDVDHETQAHGLATTGGIVGHTGVGGLSLGGGLGWLMRKHGLTVDNLVQAEVVTAEGEIVGASASDHPDLFWARRGGGGNFGIVSSFRFALHPVGPTVMAGPVFWAAEDTTDVLRFYREFVTDAPDELGDVVRLGTIPPELVVDEDLHFRPAIAVASCYAGPARGSGRTHPVRRSSKRHRRHRPPWLALLLEGHEPHPPVRRGHRHRRRARLRCHLSEVVRGDVPHGWRSSPSPAGRHGLPGV